MRSGWMTLSDQTFPGQIRAYAPGTPLFGRRKTAKILTLYGWFSMLCVGAIVIGTALAFAT